MLPWKDVMWCVHWPVSAAALAIIFIYRAFTMGSTAAVAPTAGVIGAALPAIFGMVTEGLPGFTQLLGFLIALPGIVLVSMTQTTSHEKVKKEVILLSVLSGVAAAGFFTFLSRVSSDAVVLPSLIAKAASLCTALLLVILRPKRGDEVPFRADQPRSRLLGGALDSSASALYVLCPAAHPSGCGRGADLALPGVDDHAGLCHPERTHLPPAMGGRGAVSGSHRVDRGVKREVTTSVVIASW